LHYLELRAKQDVHSSHSTSLRTSKLLDFPSYFFKSLAVPYFSKHLNHWESGGVAEARGIKLTKSLEYRGIMALTNS
jgi:hypothetical protein